MNCQELTDSISNIKAQISELDSAVGKRDPKEAIRIKNQIIEQFNGELGEHFDNFYTNPTLENYKKEANRILNKIGDRDPLEVSFSRKELIFIYDTDDKLKFSDFSHESIENIYIIREKRISKQKEDASIIFNLPPDQIAWADDIITPNTPKEDIDSILKEHITPNTKLYIGPLFPGIFDIPNLEHLYPSFPEGKIRRGEFTTCGEDGKNILEDLLARRIDIGAYAQNMLQSSEFVAHKKNKVIQIVRLKVSDLFFDDEAHTYNEIIARARELGLDDNLPHETASDLLLNKSIPLILGQPCSVASKTISVPNQNTSIFRMVCYRGGLSLQDRWTNIGDEWFSSNDLVFGLLPKSEQASV